MSTRTARGRRAVVLAHVEVAVAVEFDDRGGRPAARSVESWSWWTASAAGTKRVVPAGVGEPLGEVALVVVDEEVGVEVADLLGGRLAADQQRARLRPVDPPGRAAPALHGEQAVQEERAGERGADAGEAPGAGQRARPSESSSCAPAAAAARVGLERREQRRAPRPAAARSPRSAAGSSRPAPRAAGSSRSPPCRSAARSAIRRMSPPQRPHRVGRAVVGGVVEDEDLALDARPGGCARSPRGRRAGTRGRSCSRRSRRAWAPRAHDNRRDAIVAPMRVQLVDPSAFTPPYDRALAAALARAGAEVELVTSRFLYGPVPRGRGLPGRASASTGAAPRAASTPRAAAPSSSPSTCPTCCASAAPRDADVVHYQWLTVPASTRRLLPPRAPAGDDRPLHPAAAARAAARSRRARRVFGRMDAVVAHSEHGAARLRDEVGLDPGRVRVIPHGAFDYLTRLPEEKPLPAELEGAEGPVILFFGLLRPYKGIDDPARGLPRRSRAPSSGSSATRGWTSSRCASSAREAPRPRPLRHPLRRRRRDPGDLPPRRPRRPALPRRRALRRPLHRPRLRQADGAERRRRLPRGRRATRRRPARPARGPGGARRGARRAGRRRRAPAPSWPPPPRAPPPAPTPGTRSPRRTLDLYRELLEARR